MEKKIIEFENDFGQTLLFTPNEVKNYINALRNIKNYWINGITGELNFKQRVVGKIKIEDAKLTRII